MRTPKALLAALVAAVIVAGVTPVRSDDTGNVEDVAPPASPRRVSSRTEYIVTLTPDSNLDRVLRFWQERAGAQELFVYRSALYGFTINIPDRWVDELAGATAT